VATAPVHACNVAGAAAKIVATLVTYPIIVIKSRLQAQSSHMAPDLR
jgi:hypothetical protein